MRGGGRGPLSQPLSFGESLLLLTFVLLALHSFGRIRFSVSAAACPFLFEALQMACEVSCTQVMEGGFWRPIGPLQGFGFSGCESRYLGLQESARCILEGLPLGHRFMQEAPLGATDGISLLAGLDT